MWHCAHRLLLKMHHGRPLLVKNWTRLIHVSSSDGISLLENVIAGNLKSALALVKDNNVDVNTTDSKGWTPLMHASSLGYYDIVEALIQDESVILERQTKTGHTAVELSMFYRQQKVYELLTKAGSKNAKSYSREKLSMFSREALHRSSKEWLTQAVANSCSVFVVLRKNYPLVTRTSDKEYSIQLLKLDYPTVKRFLTEDNVIFLGVVDKASQTRKYSSQSSETNCANKDSSSDTSAACESSTQHTDSSKVPYFCVDLSNLTEQEVLDLSEECVQIKLSGESVEAELLHPYRIVTLSPADRMLYSQAWPLVDWHQRYCRCPTCGSATKMTDGGYKRVCENQECRTRKGVHNTSYPRVDPSVICAVVSPTSDRCILANKVAFPPGMFSCVAGFIEPGETIEEACVREVEEELAIDIDLETLRYMGSEPWPGPSVLMVGYIGQVCDETQNIVIDATELKSARWFKRSEVVDMLVHRHRDRFFVPPKEAIAHRLLKSWVLETAFK